MWNATRLTARFRNRLRDDRFKISVGSAVVALFGVETLRRNYERNDKSAQEHDDDDDETSLLLSYPHSYQRVECEAPLSHRADDPGEYEAPRWIPEHFSRVPRRYQTVGERMVDTAARDTLESKYAIQWRKPLGEGTFGSVYLAKDRKTGERLAVKKIPKKLTDNASFQREMDALMHLRDNGGHPHICGLRENYDENDHYYLVLDLISGGEMFDHLCAQGAYSEADAARLVREIASALAFLHGMGIVHGDMKPENLMLSSEKATVAAIKIVDFGCAQVTAEHENETAPSLNNVSKGGTANTPAYSPPEILDKNRKDDRLDPAFDMWALGVILYIMLTGVHPFDLYGNASDDEIEGQILSRHKPPLRNSPMTAHLSGDAIEVIEKLINWDPTQRMTALQLLNNPWAHGEKARTDKMADSDKRLSTYRAFNTKLEAKVFADMVKWSDDEGNDVAKRTSLIERSFQMLNPDHLGYVTAGDLRKLNDDGSKGNEADDKLCLSGFSDLLAENMKNRYFPKGQVIYQEGEIGNVMYFINSGSIEVYTNDGNKTVRKPGDFFGEGALMHPKKIRSASIRCVTPVHAIEISREYFEKYLATEEGTMLNLREKDRTRKRQRAKTILGLQQNMKQRTLTNGELVFKKGDRGNEMFIVESGKVDLMVGDHTVLTLEPGEMCGEHSLLFGLPRNISAKCVTGECQVQVLRGRDFYTLLDSHPSMKATLRDICLRREFQKAMCFKTKKAFPKKEEELRAAFEAVDASKKGVIELNEIRSMILNFDPTYSEEDVKDIVRTLDLTDSGVVRWEDFKRIFGMNGDQDQEKK
jgi:serine/threonine protein kinase